MTKILLAISSSMGHLTTVNNFHQWQPVGISSPAERLLSVTVIRCDGAGHSYIANLHWHWRDFTPHIPTWFRYNSSLILMPVSKKRGHILLCCFPSLCLSIGLTFGPSKVSVDFLCRCCSYWNKVWYTQGHASYPLYSLLII